MIELVLVACLLKEPSRCEQQYLPTAETTNNVMSCLVTGQFRAVQWQETHPGWIVRRWSCAAPRA